MTSMEKMDMFVKRIDELAREMLPKGEYALEDAEAFATILLGRAVGMFHGLDNDHKTLHARLSKMLRTLLLNLDEIDRAKKRRTLKLVPK